MQEDLALLDEYGTCKAASDATGIPYNTLNTRIHKARAAGMHLSEGMRQSMHDAKLDGMAIDGGWIITGPDGEIIKRSTRYSAKADADADQAEALAKIVSAFDAVQPAPPIIQSEKGAAGKVAFFPHSDVHIGVDIDADRGGRDYTPEIAMQRMRDGFAECHGAIQPCETAIILNNGDLTHANDDRDVTFKSQHRLKVRGSHRQNLNLAVAATVWQIDMALTRHERVVYRPNRGNHDPNTPDTLSIALRAYYAQNPRVTIDQSEREIWVWQQGLLFLSAWHGDKRKPEAVCADIAPNFPALFGQSRFWYGFTGHYHGPKQGVHNGIHWWQLPSVCSMDQHSADANFTDDAALRAMMFCERGGLKNDFTTRF
jgi:hypothetical protein